jgi:PAS domain S-box-containing protein
VVLLDSRLRILSVNAEAAHLLGHSADFCLSKLLREVLLQQPGASGDSIATRIQESRPDRRPIQKSQTTLIGPTHESHPVEWTFAPLDTNGNAGGVLTLRDLTRERELQQDYDRLARVAEESPSELDRYNRHRTAMTHCCEKFGYDTMGFAGPLELAVVQRCLNQTEMYKEVRLAG